MYPKQVTIVDVPGGAIKAAVGWVIVIVIDVEHPFESVILQVYVPATVVMVSEVRVELRVVAPLLHT